jgi:predicted Zn finger-like uncharacterized protein
MRGCSLRNAQRSAGVSLATRCTACGTVFRVVQDQLKISEGWVRCGRCKEVFNALEALFDLDREAPPPWQPPAPSPASASAVDVVLPEHEAQAPPPAAAPIAAPAPAPLAAPLPQQVESAHVVDDAVSRFGDHHETLTTGADGFVDARFDGGGSEAPSQHDADAAAVQSAASSDAPAFVRDAERRARWQSPRARAVLAIVLVALALLLTAQAGYQFRDLIAAQWPAARPALTRACEWMGCTLQPLRRIQDVAVESSTLSRSSPDPAVDALRLTVVLRNRGPLAVALPMVDLSLTDSNGELVARRALSPADFGQANATLEAGGETTLQLVFSADGRRVAGYTVEIFYP